MSVECLLRMVSIPTVFVITCVLDAAVLPKTPKFSSQAKPTVLLDYITIEVNGIPQLVSAGKAISIVRGDKVKIINAVLKNDEKKIEAINLMGFRNPSKVDSNDFEDDRNQVINTATDLKRGYALDHERTYLIKVQGKGREILGLAEMEVHEPRLDFAVAEIDQTSVILRPDEKIEMNASSKFGIKEIKSNIQAIDQIKFKLVPKDSKRKYEIQFLRDDLVFAKIPVNLKQ